MVPFRNPEPFRIPKRDHQGSLKGSLKGSLGTLGPFMYLRPQKANSVVGGSVEGSYNQEVVLRPIHSPQLPTTELVLKPQN